MSMKVTIYIEEVLKEERLSNRDHYVYNPIRATMKVNSYGNIKEETHIFGEREWNEIKKRGYYH